MILSRQVALNGQSLDGVHPAIVIQSVDPGAAAENVQVAARMTGFGARITGNSWPQREVKVRYGIDIPKKDLEARRAVYESVCAWARQKGWMTANFMPYKRLYVDKTVISSMGDPREWTNEFELTFQAYNVPFWQDEIPEIAQYTSVSSGAKAIRVKGNAPGVLDVSFKNTSGSSCANVAFTVGNNTLTFTGINLANNDTLEITHGTDGLLRAYVGTTSKYSLMTGGDDLYVEPGNRTLTLSASAAGTLTITSYGRYI
jgi:hypothetical protein